MIGGIFGRKRPTFNDEPENYALSAVGTGQGLPDQSAMTAPPKRQGFFQRQGTQDGLATFANTLIRLRSGQDLGLTDHIRQREQQQFAEAQYERKRRDGLADYAEKQKIGAQYKEPDEFTRILINAGIDPKSEAGRKFYRDLAEKKTAEHMLVSDGQGGLVSVRRPETPTRPVGKLTPIGDVTGNSGDNFRP